MTSPHTPLPAHGHTATACFYCKAEPEAGWIEMPNNGPIVPCPVCNSKTDREIEFERALAQRAAATGSAT
jgi:hypothetical protein